MSPFAKALEIHYSTERSLTKEEVILLLERSQQASDILVGMGPVFRTAFLEANNIFHAMNDIAKARGYIK